MNGRLTLEQTARTLGVSERTLRRHIAAGKIAAVKDTAPGRGGAWFFDASTVRALLPPTEEEEKEDVPASETATPAPPQPDEIARLNERLDALGHEHALLKQQMAQVLERLADADENNSPRKSRAWWPSKREA